jgi:hypothetical protein
MYFPRNWEFGSALSKLRNFRRGRGLPPTPSISTSLLAGGCCPNIVFVLTNVAGERDLTLSQLMLHICGVSKTFGEWYQKTNKTEDINKVNFWYPSTNILNTPHIWSFL